MDPDFELDTNLLKVSILCQIVAVIFAVVAWYIRS